MTSIHVLATPIIGRERSSSVKPTAFNIARAGARPGPTSRSWLFNLGSFAMPSLLFLFLVFVLVFLRFRVDDCPVGRVDMDLGDVAVSTQDLHFPHGLTVFLFEFGFYDSSRDLSHGGFDRLFGRDLRIFHEIGDVAFLVVAPGGRARADDQTHAQQDYQCLCAHGFSFQSECVTGSSCSREASALRRPDADCPAWCRADSPCRCLGLCRPLYAAASSSRVRPFPWRAVRGSS